MWTASLASFATGSILGVALMLAASASTEPLPEPRDPRVQYADDLRLFRPAIDPSVGPGSVHEGTPRRPVRTIAIVPDAAQRGAQPTLCPLGYHSGLRDECVWEGGR